LLRKNFILLGGILVTFSLQVRAQFPWPVTPFHSSQEITGTFCEFRDTGSADHFHNGTDIPKPDGSPVYSVKNGIVTNIGTVASQGSNAYVRVQDMAYVHIKPNPALSVGDSVFALQTVLGTILPGMGHVHFTNGYYGNERNSMRTNSGLTPLSDPWPPIIRWVRFYQNNSTNLFSSNKVSGRVDIVVKVDEQNGPPTSSVSRRNNGIYKIGYKILSADTSTVIYEPNSRGYQFRFDTKPSNSYVHNVFFDQLSSTTSHVYIVTNSVNRDKFWDTSAFPLGQYIVMVYAEDTRNNADTAYVAVTTSDFDAIPPQEPTLKFVRNMSDNMEVGWYQNPDPDLYGYRLFYTFDNILWKKRLDENVLYATTTDTAFASALSRDIYFRLTALDNAPVPNESAPSDVYGTKKVTDHKILIVDGFDRTETSGSWHEPTHIFAMIHGQAVSFNGFGFDTACNDAIIDGTISLQDYDAVIWLLGDESTKDETFTLSEQALIKSYLQQGGMLFVSGSEIAWDLDTDNGSNGSTPADEAFLHQFLKADYVRDDANILTVQGVAGSIFEGLQFGFGISPYEEDYPDVIKPFGEDVLANLKYSEDLIAGIQYEGVFPNGEIPGKLVYMAFPFETITGKENRNDVMGRILNFFFPETAVENSLYTDQDAPAQFALIGNFPNPFNPETTIRFRLPAKAVVQLDVYNILGQHIKTLANNIYQAGEYDVVWDGSDDYGHQAGSGEYLVRMTARKKLSESSFTQTKKVLLVR